MAIQPIEREVDSLADQAYRALSDGLLVGTLPPGSRLVMDQLASQLGISRTPVRDALQRLLNEGLIETAGGRGFVVREIPENITNNAYEARLPVECFAARRVAEIGGPAIERVERAIEASRDVDPHDVAEVFYANRAIHRAFVEALDNYVLVEMFDLVWRRAHGFVLFGDYLAHLDAPMDIVGVHEPLLVALRAGPDEAEAAMRAHITDGLHVHHS